MDEAALKRLGAKGVVWPAADMVQVIIGPDADRIAGEIGRVDAVMAVAPVASEGLSPAQIAALGGAGNVRSARAQGSRIVAELAEPARVDAAALLAAGVLASAFTDASHVHLIVDSR